MKKNTDVLNACDDALYSFDGANLWLKNFVKHTLELIDECVPESSKGYFRRLGVAVSGGQDSMFLMWAVRQWALGQKMKNDKTFELVVVHVNHGVDQKASRVCLDLDQYVQGIGLSFKFMEVNQTSFLGSMHADETTLRHLRFEAFSRFALENNLDGILLGHHADDQIETVIYRMFKGTSLQGLRGMQTHGRTGFWRPLLKLRKKDIEKACELLNLKVFEDPSNTWTYPKRNLIRRKWIPEIHALLNPNFAERVLSLSDETHQLLNAFDLIISEKLADCILNEKELDLNKFNLLQKPFHFFLLKAWIESHLPSSEKILSERVKRLVEMIEARHGKPGKRILELGKGRFVEVCQGKLKMNTQTSKA